MGCTCLHAEVPASAPAAWRVPLSPRPGQAGRGPGSRSDGEDPRGFQLEKPGVMGGNGEDERLARGKALRRSPQERTGGGHRADPLSTPWEGAPGWV